MLQLKLKKIRFRKFFEMSNKNDYCHRFSPQSKCPTTFCEWYQSDGGVCGAKAVEKIDSQTIDALCTSEEMPEHIRKHFATLLGLNAATASRRDICAALKRLLRTRKDALQAAASLRAGRGRTSQRRTAARSAALWPIVAMSVIAATGANPASAQQVLAFDPSEVCRVCPASELPDNDVYCQMQTFGQAALPAARSTSWWQSSAPSAIDDETTRTVMLQFGSEQTGASKAAQTLSARGILPQIDKVIACKDHLYLKVKQSTLPSVTRRLDDSNPLQKGVFWHLLWPSVLERLTANVFDAGYALDANVAVTKLLDSARLGPSVAWDQSVQTGVALDDVQFAYDNSLLQTLASASRVPADADGGKAQQTNNALKALQQNMPTGISLTSATKYTRLKSNERALVDRYYSAVERDASDAVKQFAQTDACAQQVLRAATQDNGDSLRSMLKRGIFFEPQSTESESRSGGWWKTIVGALTPQRDDPAAQRPSSAVEQAQFTALETPPEANAPPTMPAACQRILEGEEASVIERVCHSGIPFERNFGAIEIIAYRKYAEGAKNRDQIWADYQFMKQQLDEERAQKVWS